MIPIDQEVLAALRNERFGVRFMSLGFMVEHDGAVILGGSMYPCYQPSK